MSPFPCPGSTNQHRATLRHVLLELGQPALPVTRMSRSGWDGSILFKPLTSIDSVVGLAGNGANGATNGR